MNVTCEFSTGTNLRTTQFVAGDVLKHTSMKGKQTLIQPFSVAWGEEVTDKFTALLNITSAPVLA